ncbi:hypothetical protein [Sphingomonas sp. KC8]|uniref:hypothetical protein n=1 Tax=Sphingomonas sp. KC8 TaxID=1030157 RepID=UPI00024897B8|nr:hypothetical protein [Sphingomonas sp. KC8]
MDDEMGRGGSESEHKSAWWTFAMVQERLVEAWSFQRRMPAVVSASPFAADGPWHLVIRDRVDMAEQALAGHELVALPRVGLRSHEVDSMNEALGWIEHVRRADVRLLALAIASLEASGHRIAWTDIAPRCRLKTKTGRAMGPEALQMRYRRAIAAIAKALNGGSPQL